MGGHDGVVPMVTVSNTIIRELAGLAATDAPSDTALTDFQTEGARYVAVKVGKATIDPSSCTEGEAYVIQLIAASLARGSRHESDQLNDAERLMRQADKALDDLLSTGKIWVDVLGVNISR
jgi:hypothetical protein